MIGVVAKRIWFLGFSLVIFVIGIISLAIPPNLNLGIDFLSGTGITVSFEKEINTIGYEWKSYQGTYIITPNLCYFVHDLYGNIWRLVFTAFEGMSTGNIEFNTELMNSSTSTEHIKEISSFAIFPNPTSDNSTLIYEVSANLPEVIISDMTGRIVYKSLLNKNEFATIELPTSYLESGIYLVTITENKKSLFTEKLIVE